MWKHCFLGTKNVKTKYRNIAIQGRKCGQNVEISLRRVFFFFFFVCFKCHKSANTTCNIFTSASKFPRIEPLSHAVYWKLQSDLAKKVRGKSRECYNHKPQPFPDTKRKRKPTKPNKPKSNKCTKSTKISSLFPKRGNRNAKRTDKHKNKIT